MVDPIRDVLNQPETRGDLDLWRSDAVARTHAAVRDTEALEASFYRQLSACIQRLKKNFSWGHSLSESLKKFEQRLASLGERFFDSHIDDICPSTFKIRREWLVVDWCATAPNNEIFAVRHCKKLGPRCSKVNA